jgi:6-phosphogluconolactonase (cycloisomerase 2 family)
VWLSFLVSAVAGQAAAEKLPEALKHRRLWQRTTNKVTDKNMKRSSFVQYCSGLILGVAFCSLVAKADEGGVLYTMDNAAGANHVLIFQRDGNGNLVNAGSVGTGGTGAGSGLSSQGSIILSRDGNWLFACNAGSSEITVLRASEGSLVATDKVPSGGRMPVSLAVRHNLVYVLNAGGGAGDVDNVTAFIFANGKLLALPDSTRTLSAANTGPAQVSFTGNGDALIVTERVTSLIDTFLMDDDGLATLHKTFQSVGATPFGFDLGREDRVFVSEAQNSTASSYSLSPEGDLAVISGAVPTHQTAACWLIASRDGRFAYTANAGSGSISGFRIAQDGSLQPISPDGRTGVIGNGSHPVDMAQSRDGRFLYSVANGNGTLVGFRVMPNGTLNPLTVVGGIPNSAAGLAGR